jgi:hypothetical protein
MFRQDLKNNLKNKIMRDDKFISDMFDLIEVAIDLDDKLYEKAIKKDTINFEKERESSLNQRSNINRKNLVLIKSTII